MLDHSDRLYYRGSVPYRIDDSRVAQFNAKFGLKMSLSAWDEERDNEGKLCRTLIGCASWARILHADEVLQA